MNTTYKKNVLDVMLRFFFFSFLCILLSGFFTAQAQISGITISGELKDKISKAPISYVNVELKNHNDSFFVSGTITGEDGRFSLTGVKPGKYLLECSFTGYIPSLQNIFVGNLSQFLDIGVVELVQDSTPLQGVVVTGKRDEISGKMDKKIISVADNLAQTGGSVLQVMANLPGVTVQDGKIQIRGSDKVTVLIDGKQTALTGFGNQSSLDNIPASAIDKIEIINNPSVRFDANGNAGIINIIYKKEKKEGFNGKVGMAAGLGALWVKKENLPGIREQFTATSKLNPSLSLNYRKNKINAFFQGDILYTPTLNKNEFVTRTYDNGEVIQQQTKRNRKTTVYTGKIGMDWNIDSRNLFTISGLVSNEIILDEGDQGFFNEDITELKRMWLFLEDEVKTTVTASSTFQHKFKQPGRVLNVGLNYTFHREDEKYFFTNKMPSFTGLDAFKLLSDESVTDFTLDYIRPFRYGRLEAGMKYRRRNIPTNMQFFPGLNSPIDSNAGGKATYRENIPALYGNYVYESAKLEVEAGIRVEYVKVNYDVDINHNTYKSDGYEYTEPFPNVRVAYKFNNSNKLSFFYNRRVDRPNEVDIRIFPKYDDAEIIKVGNPALKPQFTNSFELGYKTSFKSGYVYGALYHRSSNATISRIASVVPGSPLIYSVMHNAGKSNISGTEWLLSKEVSKLFAFNINLNGYRNHIDSFSVENKYPVATVQTSAAQTIFSGNIKTNLLFQLPLQFTIQLTAIYLAPDLIPQGKIDERFSLDLGMKKAIQKAKGEMFLNFTDMLNTMVTRKEIKGNGFSYVSADYYETQVVRVGYSYKF